MASRIFFMLLLGYLVIVPSAFAKWVSDANNCKVWTSVGDLKRRNVPTMNSLAGTVQWTGTCRHGYAEGEGELVWRSENGFQAQSTYIGRMEKGVRNGQGQLIAREIGEFSGEWESDELVSGRYTSPNANTSYSGGFRKGNYHGKGVLNSGGFKTIGNWENGELVEVIEKVATPPPYMGWIGTRIQGNTVIKPKSRPKLEIAE